MSEVVHAGAYLDDWFESAPHIEVDKDISGLSSRTNYFLYYSTAGLPRTALKRNREHDHIDGWNEGASPRLRNQERNFLLLYRVNLNLISQRRPSDLQHPGDLRSPVTSA